MQNFDVVIAGGGIAGLTLALGLGQIGMQVALIEPHPPQMTVITTQTAYQLRVSAINAASQQLFNQLGVWSDMVTRRVSVFREMAVWEKESFAYIHFNSDGLGRKELGHIIENEVIRQALWQRLQRSSQVTLLAERQLEQVEWGEHEAFIRLSQGQMLTAKLVVAADGASSWLRGQADIPLTAWDYQHHALMAIIQTELPHQEIARQQFYPDGVLAFLPLAQQRLSAIVWSVAPEQAGYLQQLASEDFNRQLATTFDLRLGLCQLVSDRAVFPLTGRYARDFAAHRLVLVADAAHTVHPLAGQGINLGLMDVACLLEQLHSLQQAGKDFGRHYYLRRYERERKLAAVKLLATMQGFRDLFAGAQAPKKLFRGLGFMLGNQLPFLKQKIMRQAMGLDECVFQNSEAYHSISNN